MNPQTLHRNSPTFKLNPNNLTPFDTFFTPLPHINLNMKSKRGFCSFRKRVYEFPIVTRNHRHSVSIKCEGSMTNNDSFYMKRCVEIAKKAIGCTSPNPMVGCVIVKDGVVVGEGFHPKAGQPHAEVFALKDAGNLAENATAYVSLEPCNHYGRTPPCTEALIRAKVKRVVVGMVDPNPIVASKGVNKLRESGIDVTVGVEEESCKKLNQAYIHRMLTGKPFVTLRYSLSVNGRFSDKPGGYYSQLLQEYDGVIGKSFPTSQQPEAKQPLQITIAKASKSIIFQDRNTIVETVVLDELNLNAVLDCCAQRGLCSVMLDLQGSVGELKEIVEEGVENGLVQKVVVEILPVWGGGEESALLENLGKRVLKLKKMESEMMGETVVVHGYF